MRYTAEQSSNQLDYFAHGGIDRGWEGESFFVCQVGSVDQVDHFGKWFVEVEVFVPG